MLLGWISHTWEGPLILPVFVGLHYWDPKLPKRQSGTNPSSLVFLADHVVILCNCNPFSTMPGSSAFALLRESDNSEASVGACGDCLRSFSEGCLLSCWASPYKVGPGRMIAANWRHQILIYCAIVRCPGRGSPTWRWQSFKQLAYTAISCRC